MPRRLAVAILAVVLAGCGTSPGDDVHVRNGTSSLVVVVRLAGAPVARLDPGAETVLAAGSLGLLPWHLDAVTESGRVLATLDIAGGGAGCSGDAGGRGCHGSLARVDLSCGRFEMFTGDIQPMGPVPDPAAAFAPGDCDP